MGKAARNEDISMCLYRNGRLTSVVFWRTDYYRHINKFHLFISSDRYAYMLYILYIKFDFEQQTRLICKTRLLAVGPLLITTGPVHASLIIYDGNR